MDSAEVDKGLELGFNIDTNGCLASIAVRIDTDAALVESNVEVRISSAECIRFAYSLRFDECVITICKTDSRNDSLIALSKPAGV